MDKFETNIWNNISLSDYEQHMQHETVGQLQLLNGLTKKYLEKYKPSNLLFLGIAGGNGLEHVDATKVKTVLGVDINATYLEETKKRFGKRIRQLKLANIDITTSKESLTNADFVWAALILEYTDLNNSFEFITNNICSSANIIVTIQANNEMQSISQTGIESIKLVGQIFRLVDKIELLKIADKFGLAQIGFEENVLPNKKSFLTYTFGVRTMSLPPGTLLSK